MTDIWNRTYAPGDPDYDRDQAERVAIFNKIANRENWKLPIHTWISEADFEACLAASRFFTGAPIAIVARDASRGEVLVSGIGYYARCGA